MKINSNVNDFFSYKMQNENRSHMIPTNAFAEREPISVKVSISEEGKKTYRNSLEQESEDYKNVTNRRQELISGKYMPEKDFSFELGNKLAAYEQKDKYMSLEDKAFNLLKAYADLYDEIVQGYESGTREQYSEEEIFEGDQRELTMFEEIKSLNVAYKKYADNLEELAQQAPKIAAAHEKYMKKLSKIGAERAELASKAQDIYAMAKNERPLDNISEKIIAASNVFVEQYTKQNLRSIGIENILKNIMIFENQC